MGIKEAIKGNEYTNRLIENLGREEYYKNLKKYTKDMLKQDNDFFNLFFKDWKYYKYLSRKHSKEDKGYELADYIVHLGESNIKSNIIIFKIDEDEIKKNLNVNQSSSFIFPHNRFFIDRAFYVFDDDQKERYTVWGFLVESHPKSPEIYRVCYLMSKSIDDGLIPQAYAMLKEKLKKNDWTSNNDLTYIKRDNDIPIKIKDDILDEITRTIKVVLNMIETKEYTTYKKWTSRGYETKSIVYSSDVKTHKRHFWETSGRFKIPFMSKKELIDKGYGIDELVIHNNEMKQNVPFRIIGSYKINQEGKSKKENKIINLISKRVLRQEEKLGRILHELFPNEYIKRHDRKMLKGLELDFFIRNLRLGFEYDGEQHFDQDLCERVFKSDFKALQKRDRLKNKLCRKKRITLIRIKYDEPLTKTYVKKKLKENNIL